MKHIILFGFKSCGKTYLGKKLAQQLGHSFLDTDLILEELYAQKYGKLLKCPQIYRQEGSKVFRDLERLALLSLQHYPMSIVAVGGGAVLEADNLQVLQCVGRLVYLLISKEGLRQRLYLQDQPAFFDASCFDEAFEKMYRLRLPLYEAIYAHKIDVEVGTEEQILNRLKEAVHGK